MGANTNAPLIMSIFSFYIIIIVMMGFIGGSIIGNIVLSTPATPTTNPLTIFDWIGFFFSGIAFSLASIPVWVNIVLFLPLGITVAYIIASFVRGSS